ncbi:MAG: hypothetical protein DHS20C06_14040 [Hyphobacterium sp.]|nr:MAG: hypothetical protein DHS20C06_14040 [Hyphobacterium sp.]
MRFMVLVLSMLFGGFPATFAEDPLPEPLVAAFANTVPMDSDMRRDWRFQVSVYSEDGPLLALFDGENVGDAQWILLSPSVGDLTRIQQAVWDDTRSGTDDGESESGLFIGDDAAEIIGGDVELVAETDDTLTYTFAPYLGEDGMDAAIARHLVGEITIRREPPAVEQIRLYAPERFRAQMILRIDAFEMVMQFSRLDGLAVPVFSRIASRIEGSAAFQDISERTEMTFESIEYLGVQPD